MTQIIVLISTFLGCLASIYGIATYFNDKVQKPNEQLQALIVQYRTNQQVGAKLLKDMRSFADRNCAYEKYFTNGITFRSYIDLLERTIATELNEELLKKMTDSKLSESMIQTLNKNLDNQLMTFTQVRGYFDLVFASTSNEFGNSET